MSDEEEDIILAELDDEELVQQMFDDLYDGLKEEIEEGVNILLERGWVPYDVLTKALVGGMTIVGADFRDGTRWQNGDRHGQGRHSRHR